MASSLTRLPGNDICADCHTPNPRWASINLGILICIECSGVHRALGTHVSQVRSIGLDQWMPYQIEQCQRIGNISANRFWEAKLPSSFHRPSPDDRRGLEDFIKAKYVDKKWAASSSPGKKQEAPPSGPTISSSNDDIFLATEDPFSQEVVVAASSGVPTHTLDDLWAAPSAGVPSSPDSVNQCVSRNYENIERALMEPQPNLDPISAAIRRLDV